LRWFSHKTCDWDRQGILAGNLIRAIENHAASGPPSPFGFGAAAFTRFASEGWWAL
jgi:hypothetical protein